VAVSREPLPALDAAAGARAWQHDKQALACDVIARFAHGTVLRAGAHPGYYAYNLVRIERDPGMGLRGLLALADRALAGLEHRRIDFEVIAPAEALRAEFARAGWRSSKTVWMRHEQPLAATSERAAERVGYDEAAELRARWEYEDNPELDHGDHLASAREIALAREPVVFLARERGQPVAFAQLERIGQRAEISEAYVHPDRRGAGLGTAVTAAAVAAATGARELWIAADAEDRPQRLYERLGFRPVWTVMEFTRWPPR
jgi:ribosomal protein S18 acetylase RimI-like enzyme